MFNNIPIKNAYSEINISSSYFITEIDEIDNMISTIKEKIKKRSL